ncbi:hypothetical protein BST63_36195 [Bradyrhizobium canariense]|uniref:Uncharacterized protein n=1 Tax=Bradyrhizobium canariense TaxID=255045 RepID=A0ABX3WUU1_9BRAD|nr:hypothetical protein BSR47_31200 [Bradyrhizobium canariense]OSJ21149.1 hypothetical protein BST63_36195 [Bradyrhizobium canariense]
MSAPLTEVYPVLRLGSRLGDKKTPVERGSTRISTFTGAIGSLSSRAFLLGARKHWRWHSCRKKQRKKKCQSLTRVMLLRRQWYFRMVQLRWRR